MRKLSKNEMRKLSKKEMSAVSGGWFTILATIFGVTEATGGTNVISFVKRRLAAGRPECTGRRNGRPWPENCAYRGVEEFEAGRGGR